MAAGILASSELLDGRETLLLWLLASWAIKKWISATYSWDGAFPVS